MADLVVEGTQLVVRLSRWERMAAFHDDVSVPLNAVRSVQVEPDPWHALRGIRSPGTGWPGVIAFGTRRVRGERPDFSAILRRRPAVRVELDPPAEYSWLLVTVSDPEATVASIRAAARL